MDAGSWQDQVQPHFAFLEGYGFRITASDASSPWETSVTYKSSTGGVKVTNSNEFFRAEVNLIRLVDGHVPPYPIWITDEPINWALLDNVLEVRSPERLEPARSLKGLGKADVDRQLEFWADCLNTVAADFLDGDMSAIDEASAVIRARVREHPQQMTVWLPDSAPAGADAAEFEQASTTVPPEVGVKVRRYRRKRWPG